MPGAAGRAGEVLAQEPAEPTGERPGTSRRRRPAVLLLLAVLLLGAASVAVDRQERPEPAPEQQVVSPAFPGVQASSQLVSQDRLRVRLLVEVRIAAGAATTALPDTGASAAQVRLQGISAPGLVVRIGEYGPPVLLGYVGRFGSGLEQVVRLTVDVVALGCAEPERPRRLAMSLTRSSGTPGSPDVDATLQVRDRAEVAQALEALVRRSCRGAGR